MTYSFLLTQVYANYATLRAELSRMFEKYENIGAFVFEPEGYSTAETFAQVKYEFWPITVLQEYLAKGAETDEGLWGLIEDVNIKEEFLVMIIEPVDRPKRRAIHIHKITKVGFN
jgi:hypothetical protein